MNLTHTFPFPADPTAFDLGGDTSVTDPRIRRINARTAHGGHFVAAPFMSEIAPNLWHGGVESGLVLPDFVKFKLSLYQWEDYTIEHELVESLTVEMYDSVNQGFDQVMELAEWVNERRAHGPVFVHCQAGLNRSSLVVAIALLLSGEVSTGQEAIDLIREKRDPACLCNPAFEKWVRSQPGGEA
ncbi:MAG: dual specificity protein phosphatase family protein [Microbacterium sp.]|uniref:dual specificity protein phosphatase family protein n=1 Tax=Microbacterium sp. TaxID=51671 RepID=UPI0025E9952F|nr:dual specificity protein phosphatase family protein [Microbacterium sp.]MBQ9917416.1 dual specificity protein phosphatase family protein [Microbacterium sp.]